MDQPLSVIDGWLFDEEAELLDRYNVGVWCEIGSWKGKSTVVLAAKHDGYAIDWFKGSGEPGCDYPTLDEFIENIRPYRHNISLIPKRFEDAVDDVREPIDLLFLDAKHTYEATALAYSLYMPLVVPGGHIIFHDAWGENGEKKRTPWPGVTDFCLDLRRMIENVENVRRCAVFRKP